MKIPWNKRQLIVSLNLLLLSAFLLPALSKDIKIGLTTTQLQVTITSNEKAVLINLFTNKKIAEINKFDLYNVQNINQLISITKKSSTEKLGAFTGPIKLIPENKNGLVFCNKNWYRGELIIMTSPDKKNLTVVNNVDLEDYLLSVVPSEIPHTWNKEVLKAQSVAARSYALGYLARRKDKGYDLESSVEDQLYLGVSKEKKSTSYAVKETSGVILVDNENKPIIALYHSSGGGYTDSIENLWDEKPSIYIQPKPDYDDNSPHFKWFRNYKISDVNNSFSDLKVGTITEIIPLSKSVSQRVTWLKIIGTNGRATIRGEDFRKHLKLPSSKFNFVIEDDEIKFAGRGFGHGLGLSQWGAKALAEDGFTYEQILAHYYSEAMLIKLQNNE